MRLVGRCHYRSGKVENEKGIILEELRGFDPEDDFYPLKIGQGIFCHRMPLGTTDDIRKVTPQVLKNYYRNGMYPLWQHWSL